MIIDIWLKDLNYYGYDKDSKVLVNLLHLNTKSKKVFLINLPIPLIILKEYPLLYKEYFILELQSIFMPQFFNEYEIFSMFAMSHI